MEKIGVSPNGSVNITDLMEHAGLTNVQIPWFVGKHWFLPMNSMISPSIFMKHIGSIFNVVELTQESTQFKNSS